MSNLECYNCGNRKLKTIYPKGYVQKKCMICGHKTTPVKIPDKIINEIAKNYIDWGKLM